MKTIKPVYVIFSEDHTPIGDPRDKNWSTETKLLGTALSPEGAQLVVTEHFPGVSLGTQRCWANGGQIASVQTPAGGRIKVMLSQPRK